MFFFLYVSSSVLHRGELNNIKSTLREHMVWLEITTSYNVLRKGRSYSQQIFIMQNLSPSDIYVVFIFNLLLSMWASSRQSICLYCSLLYHYGLEKWLAQLDTQIFGKLIDKWVFFGLGMVLVLELPLWIKETEIFPLGAWNIPR